MTTFAGLLNAEGVNMKRILQARSQSRRGMGRIDVIVLIAVGVLLCSIVGPGLFQKRRGPAKLMTCMNNLRQVGLANIAFASNKDGVLPSLSTDIEITNAAGQTGTIPMSWQMQILPALDATAVLKNIKKNAVVVSVEANHSRMEIAETERIWLPVFGCPNDADSDRTPGGLSYVANAGFMSRSLYHGDPKGLHRVGQMSWDGNNVCDESKDVAVSAATGVFWHTHPSFKPSLDFIATGDGMSTTLMLTENLQAGLWHDTDTAKIGFGLPINDSHGQILFGTETFFESVESPLNTQFSGGTLTSSTPQDWRINAGLKAKTGTQPRPSSNHQGGVNVMFCDGSVRFLNEKIDPHVYVRLLTPNGLTYGEKPLQTSDF
jgi:prepilin-type processing-associated H-X9-DG protein